MPLASVAVRHLRGLGHHLEPVVQIGKEGVTEGITKATERALLDHELIKVRIGTEAPDGREEAAKAIAAAAKAELVQVLGRTCLLYKRHPQKPKIKLPRAPASATKSELETERGSRGGLRGGSRALSESRCRCPGHGSSTGSRRRSRPGSPCR